MNHDIYYVDPSKVVLPSFKSIMIFFVSRNPCPWITKVHCQSIKSIWFKPQLPCTTEAQTRNCQELLLLQAWLVRCQLQRRFPTRWSLCQREGSEALGMRRVGEFAVSPWWPIISSTRWVKDQGDQVPPGLQNLLVADQVFHLFLTKELFFSRQKDWPFECNFHQEVGGGDVAATVLQMLYHVREANAVFLTKVFGCLMNKDNYAFSSSGL